MSGASPPAGDGDLRQALRRFVTGVTVVTTLDAEGRLTGLTANSFTSVSLEPPLVLVCVAVDTRSYETLTSCRCFAIHILGEDQSAIASAFAVRGGDRAESCAWAINARGFAVLDHALAVLECRLADEYRAGDHAILIGQVENFATANEPGVPLVFYGGKLFGLGQVAA